MCTLLVFHNWIAVFVSQALADHTDITEAAVVAKPDKMKGHVPVGFVVLKAGERKSKFKQKHLVVCRILFRT